jgi:hypothetical protein
MATHQMPLQLVRATATRGARMEPLPGYAYAGFFRGYAYDYADEPDDNDDEPDKPYEHEFIYSHDCVCTECAAHRRALRGADDEPSATSTTEEPATIMKRPATRKKPTRKPTKKPATIMEKPATIMKRPATARL